MESKSRAEAFSRPTVAVLSRDAHNSKKWIELNYRKGPGYACVCHTQRVFYHARPLRHRAQIPSPSRIRATRMHSTSETVFPPTKRISFSGPSNLHSFFFLCITRLRATVFFSNLGALYLTELKLFDTFIFERSVGESGLFLGEIE